MSSAARPADHPRSRGVYTGYSVTRTVRGGSSPLARGLRCPLSDKRLTAGIIPARAGFTRLDGAQMGTYWDHPRSRGVYEDSLFLSQWPEGSSPLARGLPDLLITHPRVEGSSPLARGLRRPRRRHRRRRRIIPARAGFTVEGRWGIQEPRIIPARAGFTGADREAAEAHADHPRSRGVYDDGSDGEGAEVGSSPLARGLRCRRWRPRRRGRIIPARAGFTVSRSPRAPRGRDHPRSRGVYSSVSRRLLLPTGSSPLARGLLLLRLSRSAGIGIIPARAGFTRRPRKSHQYSPDHPRSRGVYAPLYC